jgi:propionyl-CoA carboxylase alpha chain
MLERFVPPDDAGIRWDNGVESGSEISPYYDSMLAKVIAHAPTRTEAVRRLAAALRRLEVHGLTTNRELLVATLEHPAFEAGRVDTGFYDAHPEVLAPKMPDGIRRVHAVGAALVLRDRRHRAGDDHAVVPAGWRNVAPATEREEFEIPASTLGRDAIAVSLVREPGFAASVDVRVDDEPVACAVVDVGDAHADVELDGLRAKCMVRSYGDRHYVNGMGWQSELVERDRFGAASVEGTEHGTMAPVPGTITEVAVTEGQWMQAGDLLVVLEAMKIQHRIVATADGVVEKVWVEVGDRVDAHQVLVDIGERSGEGEES